jgi:uncharacterized protein (TIGR00255 family)
MTGYGRRTFSLNGKNIVVEIKALNSKTFDLNLRLSSLFKEFEMEIRNIVNKRIGRGKIDCSIGFEMNDEKNGDLNLAAIREYYRQIRNAAAELGVDDENLFDLVFRLPNVTQTSNEQLSSEQYKDLFDNLNDACTQLEKFRKDEGNNLKKDLTERVGMILAALSSVEELDPSRIEQQRNKLLTDLKNYFADEQIDKNRFEQELIFYLEKMDITEEVTRLKSHCNYFIETIHDPVTEKGKKLGFICQEMNREINTIGSKAYHAEMQKKVVVMKDELEKIKEQLNNVL